MYEAWECGWPFVSEDAEPYDPSGVAYSES